MAKKEAEVIEDLVAITEEAGKRNIKKSPIRGVFK